jgi:hypothetical protein
MIVLLNPIASSLALDVKYLFNQQHMQLVVKKNQINAMLPKSFSGEASVHTNRWLVYTVY